MTKYVVVLFGSEGHGQGCTLNRCPMEAISVASREVAATVMEQNAAFDPHFLRVEATP